jgi:oligopeptide/dipeptide ABC transporter ATP-binding protein
MLAGHAVWAVKDVSFTVGRGEAVGLVGESGSGKSTIGRLLLGLIAPSEGRVLLEGTDISGARGAELRKLRRRIQLVFQEPYSVLADLRSRLGLGMLFISHGLPVVRSLCDRVIVLYLGRVMEEGPAANVLATPLHLYTRVLISAVPTLDPTRRRMRILLQGDPPNPVDPPSGCVFRTRCPFAIAQCGEVVLALRPVGTAHYAACIRDDIDPGGMATATAKGTDAPANVSPRFWAGIASHRHCDVTHVVPLLRGARAMTCRHAATAFAQKLAVPILLGKTRATLRRVVLYSRMKLSAAPESEGL